MKYIISFVCLFSFNLVSVIAESVDSEISSLKKIHDYIHSCPLAVISTIDVSNKHSQSALIAFTENGQLELYFMTFVDSRKYINLQNDQNVSIVIGFGYITIQYEGVVHELKEEVIAEALYAFSNKETPCTPDFLSNPRARFFKIMPKWIRYSDYSICPPQVVEKYW